MAQQGLAVGHGKAWGARRHRTACHSGLGLSTTAPAPSPPTPHSPSWGSSAATALTANEAVAPSPTRLFMSGAPRASA